MRDTLVFGLKSDKVRKDAIALGNELTFKQIYDLAKTEESTKTQMEIISSNNSANDIHAMKRQPTHNHKSNSKSVFSRNIHSKSRMKDKNKSSANACQKCGGRHNKYDNCPAIGARCNYCGRTGHFKRVCRNMQKERHKLHEVADKFDSHNNIDDGGSRYEYEDESGNIGCINTNVLRKQQHTVNGMSSHEEKVPIQNKIFVQVKLNDKFNANLKIDTGADICTITKDDIRCLGMKLKVENNSCVLHKYGGGKIKTFGQANIKVTFNGKSMMTKFILVEGNGSPSVLGCKQSQELGVITVNLHEIKSGKLKDVVPCNNQKSGKLKDVIPCNDKTTCQGAAEKGNMTKSQILDEYKDCFDKIGCFPHEKYHIQLKDDAQPIVHPPRSVPVHIMPLYKAELENMIANDVVEPVTQPTDWVNSIVCNVTKTSEGKQKVRLCLDPKDLNKNIKREHYYSRTIDEILPKLHAKKYFSVVDTKKGFWHVELDEESSLLCTFNTPFGRHKFKRLAFGTCVSQDVFQKKLDDIFQNIPNVTGIADDIIVYGETPEEHDKAFINMLNACRQANVGLNSEKLQFKQSKVEFYGHTLSDRGIQPAEDKLRVIRNIIIPTNTKELLAILGMITYLNRFSTKIAELTAPLRKLTKKNVKFVWESKHENALKRIKAELCTARILSYYDPSPNTTTILQCDASLTGLGAWIRQIDNNGEEKIVAMGSRSLTDAESRYSNIERECLAVAYGLERFEYYLYGRHVLVETDHSPLEQIFKKNIVDAPARLQRLLLKCLKFDITVKYKQGTKIPVADALSRVIENEKVNNVDLHEIHFIARESPPINMEILKEATDQDIVFNKLKETIYKGWPAHRKQYGIIGIFDVI